MNITHTMANDTIAQRPKRHYYSPELKGQIVAECQVSGASVAGVALAHGINANIVHRWMREQAVLHPGYGFEQHVGYATTAHRAAIREAGPSRLHRRSFASPAFDGFD